MSFDSNPYYKVEVVKNPERPEEIRFYCESCGGGWRMEPLTLESSIGELFGIWEEHLRSSHKLNREDVIHWTIL